MRREILAVALLTWGGGAVAHAGDAASLLTQGKLDADMGDGSAAAVAFEAVAEDSDRARRVALGSPDPPRPRPSGRGRRERGRRGFPARSGGTTVRTRKPWLFSSRPSAGSYQAPERWNAIWQKVVVKVDAAKTDPPTMRVEWPGVPGWASEIHRPEGRPRLQGRRPQRHTPPLRRCHGAERRGVTPAFRVRPTFASRTSPGTTPSIASWPRTASRPVSWAPSSRSAGPSNWRLHADSKGSRSTWISKASIFKRRFATSPNAAGGSSPPSPLSPERSLSSSQGVPWDQAFDLVARLNGLAWKQEGTRIRVGLPHDLK